jgi:hypothetical protein
MPENEQEPSLLQSIEDADSPIGVANVLGGLSLRHIAVAPISIGRDLLKIVMNGDAGEMVRASSSHM